MRDDLRALLDRLGLNLKMLSHPPVHTVEEAEEHYAGLEGAHTKNLFLKDAKGALFLVTLPANRKVDMKALAPLIGAKKLSFGSPDLMRAVLETEPGSLGPLSLIADRERRVRFAIDATLLDAESITCHPLDNTQTWVIPMADMRRILADWEIVPIEINFEAA